MLCARARSVSAVEAGARGGTATVTVEGQRGLISDAGRERERGDEHTRKEAQDEPPTTAGIVRLRLAHTISR